MAAVSAVVGRFRVGRFRSSGLESVKNHCVFVQEKKKKQRRIALVVVVVVRERATFPRKINDSGPPVY